MKKIAVWMLLLALAFTLAALAEEGYAGRWVSGRAVLTIEETGEDAYTCTIHWGGSAFDEAVWEYPEGLYDEVGDSIATFETGVKRIVTYAEGGEVVSTEVEYEDGAATFHLNDDGTLTWTDYKETPGENEIVFERAVEE